MQALTTQQESTIYTLAAELMAAAPSDADRARIDRALDLVETVERTANPGRFLVPSQSNPNGAYLVDHGTCHCPDAAKRDSRNCKHSWAVRLFCAAERLEAEQDEPAADETYYCVLCDEPIPAAEDVETPYGFMHERCAASEPPADPDAPISLELTGRGYLTLVPATGLPPALGGCTRLPYTAEQARIISELYGDDPSAA